MTRIRSGPTSLSLSSSRIVTKIVVTTMMRKGFVVIMMVAGMVITTASAKKRRDGVETARDIRIINECGFNIDLFWIHPYTRKLADSNTEGEGIAYGSETGISSYVGHEFEIQEMPNKRTGECVKGPDQCRKGYFQVNENEDQWITIHKGLKVTIDDNKSRAMEKAQKALTGCDLPLDDANKDMSIEEQLDWLTACMEERINQAIHETDDEIQFQSITRRRMGEKMIQYVCYDDKVKSTTWVANRTWSYVDLEKSRKAVQREMRVLFESDYSNIQLVEDFLTEAECAAVQDESIADPSSDVGSTRLLPKSAMHNRLVRAVIRRIESFVSNVLGSKISYNKDPMLGVRINSPPADTLLQLEQPECTIDEHGQQDCRGVEQQQLSPIQQRQQHAKSMELVQADPTLVASLMVICDAPKMGGSLHFPKTGTHLQTRDFFGAAMIMVHEDLDNGLRENDPFIDDMVICPVQQGNLVTVIDHYAR